MDGRRRRRNLAHRRRARRERRLDATTTGLTTGAFGSLVVDPTDRTGNTLYAGSGEPNGSSDSEAGVGLFRSTDGGTTWSLSRERPGRARTARSGRSRSTRATGRSGSALTSAPRLVVVQRRAAHAARRAAARPLQVDRRGASFTLAFSQAASPRTRRRAPTPSRAASTRSSSTRATRARCTPRSSATASGARRRASSAATRRSSRSSSRAIPDDTFGDRTEFDLATIDGV